VLGVALAVWRAENPARSIYDERELIVV